MSVIINIFYFLYHTRYVSKSIEPTGARKKIIAKKTIILSMPREGGDPKDMEIVTDIILFFMMASHKVNLL